MISPTIVLACLMASFVSANWDPSTGYVLDYTVSDAWLKANPPTVVTREIQISECAQNTRLHFPKVQLFALFKTNHKEDHYHGCPYGDCLAFTVAPNASDLVPSYTDNACFFWHHTGGIPGNHTKPISDPQTGAYGYEQSLNGKFHSGVMDISSLQLDHDGHYPGFSESKLSHWSPADVKKFSYQKQLPAHPKCGRPCEPNKDPGSAPGAYGNYKPAPASAYRPPPDWIPGPEDTCFHNGSHGKPGPGNGNNPGSGGNGNNTHPVPGHGGKGSHEGGSSHNSTKPKHSSGSHCKSFCKCLKKCQDDDCSSCDSKNKNGCSKDDCAVEKRTRKCR